MGSWQTVDVGGNQMRAYVSIPEGAGQVPGVVAFHGANGLDAFMERITDRFAAAGYAAISPDLFHRGEPQRPPDGGPKSSSMKAQDFVDSARAAMNHLGSQPGVDGNRIGVTGFCMGGQTTYLVAGSISALKAAVAFYPGNVFMRLNTGADDAPFDRTSHIACPILILTGREDGNPSPDDVAKMDAELTRLGKVHECHIYEGAEHLFMTESSPRYREHAAKDGWERCLAWFGTHL